MAADSPVAQRSYLLPVLLGSAAFVFLNFGLPIEARRLGADATTIGASVRIEMSRSRISSTKITPESGALKIELMAAASQPGQAVGYLALLRRFVAELEEPPHRRGVLRGLVAPELPPMRFDGILDAAEGAEAECRA